MRVTIDIDEEILRILHWMGEGQKASLGKCVSHIVKEVVTRHQQDQDARLAQVVEKKVDAGGLSRKELPEWGKKLVQGQSGLLIESSLIEDIESQWSPLATREGERRIAFLVEELANIEKQPDRYPLAPESVIIGMDVSQAIFADDDSVYRLLFSITGENIRVLQLRHGSRRHVFE